MNSANTVRYLAMEAERCRRLALFCEGKERLDLLEMHALLYPSMLTALELRAMSDPMEIEHFKFDFKQTLAARLEKEERQRQLGTLARIAASVLP